MQNLVHLFKTYMIKKMINVSLLLQKERLENSVLIHALSLEIRLTFLIISDYQRYVNRGPCFRIPKGKEVQNLLSVSLKIARNHIHTFHQALCGQK